jgi:hypothetical protein
MFRTSLHDPLIRARRESFEDELLGKVGHWYYEGVANKIIIEKSRNWTDDPLNLANYLSPSPKVVVLLRPISEIVASFVFHRRCRNDPLPERFLLQSDTDILLASIRGVAAAFQKVSDRYLFGTYDQLVSSPHSFMTQVCNFWHIPLFDWHFDELSSPFDENDEASNNSGLHEVRPNLEKRQYEVKISKYLTETAKRFDEALWEDYEQAKKICPSAFIK